MVFPEDGFDIEPTVFLTLMLPNLVHDYTFDLPDFPINIPDFEDFNFFEGPEELKDIQEQIDAFIEDLNNFDASDYYAQIINSLDFDFLGLDTNFFDDYYNIFDGIDIEINSDMSSNFQIFFSDIDLTFLNEVDAIITDFELTNYLQTIFSSSDSTSERINDLDLLLDNLEELTVLNDAVTRSLIRGTSASDMIRGLPRSDILLGLEGNDILRGQKGNDLINGGPGNDTLRGKSGDDLLFGNVGKDNIKGGNGNDILDGGEGRDILTGGGGNDIYMLQSGSGFDRIHGLKVGKDTIQFQNDINPSDLVLLNWRDGTLIRFNNGANMKGRIAWIRNLDASQISIDDIINVSNVADPSTL